jgi:hypothetical protein
MALCRQTCCSSGLRRRARPDGLNLALHLPAWIEKMRSSAGLASGSDGRIRPLGFRFCFGLPLKPLPVIIVFGCARPRRRVFRKAAEGMRHQISDCASCRARGKREAEQYQRQHTHRMKALAPVERERNLEICRSTPEFASLNSG